MKLSSIPSKEFREVAAAAISRGWVLSRTKRHGRLMKPGCQTQVFPMTGSDWRGLANLKAGIRRAEEQAE